MPKQTHTERKRKGEGREVKTTWLLFCRSDWAYLLILVSESPGKAANNLSLAFKMHKHGTKDATPNGGTNDKPLGSKDTNLDLWTCHNGILPLQCDNHKRDMFLANSAAIYTPPLTC